MVGRTGMKHRVIGAGFALLRASRMHRLAAPMVRGAGVILMFHHVRPASRAQSGRPVFAPNDFLEITPQFLETVVETVRAEGFEIISMDDAARRMTASPEARNPSGRPFAVLTFDDGYRDNLQYALPVLRREQAPFTIYAVSGYAARTARLWWRELEIAIAMQERIACMAGGRELVLSCVTPEEKQRAYDILIAAAQTRTLDDMLAWLDGIAGPARVDGAALVARECMDWNELTEIALDPLCSIGVHTVNHPLLANESAELAEAELRDCQRQIRDRVGVEPVHLAYPVGGPLQAGAREFAMAADLGFASAVTTRPGMIFPAHAAHMTALPRLSVNGRWQDRAFIEVLLSGAPFAVWNRGRRVNPA